jgi:hypothetical protein
VTYEFKNKALLKRFLSFSADTSRTLQLLCRTAGRRDLPRCWLAGSYIASSGMRYSF